jgi:hypothetical protein
VDTDGVSDGDNVEALIQSFRSLGKNSGTVWKLDRLLDIVALDDPRIVDFLLEVLANLGEPIEVRREVLNRLRGRTLEPAARARVARTAVRLLRHDPSFQVRLQAAVALGEWTDVSGTVASLGAVACDEAESFDLRYAAFASIERSNASPEAVAALRQLVTDDVLGRSADNMLRMWHTRSETS